MNNDKNINISENAQDINVTISDIKVGAEENVVVTEISAPTVFNTEIAEAEIVDIIIDEAFPSAVSSDTVNHSHPISAIVNLEGELADINNTLTNLQKIKPVYSSQSGLSEFRKWHDENPNGENRSGYFVTIVDETDDVEICDSTHDVYGISVSTSGFIGNQDEYDKTDDYAYALVGIVGALRVRADGTARVGEYVVPNRYGEATLSESGFGYKVLSEGSYPSYNYVTIAVTPQSDALSRIGGSGAGTGDLSDIIIEINGIKDTVGNLQVQVDGAMSPDDVQDIINENLADLNTKIDNANSVASTANASAQLAQVNASQAASVASQAQQAAQSAAKEAINTATSAATSAQSAINIANQALQDATDTADDVKDLNTKITQHENNITLIQQKSNENEAAILSATQRIDETAQSLTLVQQQVTATELSISSIVNRVDEQGNSIASVQQQAKEITTKIEGTDEEIKKTEAIIQHLVSHVDKYSVGEYSISYGLTLEEAQQMLTTEHIYIPTHTHSETMVGSEEFEFERNYVYTWDVDNSTWNKSTEPISTATEYKNGINNGDLWYCWQDVEQLDENGEVIDTYYSGVLYRWFEDKWVAVATNADNHQSRIITSVKQTAEGIKSDVVDLQGNVSQVSQTIDGLSVTVKQNTDDIAAVNVRADGINATISSFQESTNESITGLNQTMSSIQLDVQENANAINLINTGRFHLRYSGPILGEAPVVSGNKYSALPVWDDALGEFVFNDDYIDNENGIYYFFGDDKTRYCKLVDDNYELYTIGNQATSALNSRIDENEAGLDLLAKYVDEQDNEVKESVAVIALKADANEATINSVTSYYYHTLLSISETEIPVLTGELRYSNKPTWDPAEGKYVFNINDRAEDGAYYLIDSDASTYCKVVTAGDGSTLYEIYGLAGSYMAAIQQGADENGGYIQSIVMDIERYNVGQYSPSYGMSYDDAVISIPKGTMYVPTTAHSENLIPDARVSISEVGVDVLSAGTLEDRESGNDVSILTTTPFDALGVETMQTYDFAMDDDQTYSYEWNGVGWQQGDVVSLSTEYYSGDGSEVPQLWYCTKDVTNTSEVVSGTGGVYKQGTLYAWHGGRWFAVATVSDSLLSRSLSLVRQTANSYSIELRNMQGDFSQYKQTVTDIGMLVSGADGSSGQLNITKEGIVGEVYNRTGNSATLKAQADATQAVLDLVVSGLYHKLEQPLTDGVPNVYNNGNKYSSRPTWVASLGKFVFYESTKSDDGVYYFFDGDETHYCKVVGEQHEVYTIGTLSTAGTDAHITEEFASINTLAYYGDDETSTIAGLRNLALEGRAQVQLLASLDNNKLNRIVNVHGYTVPEGTKRYANKPVYLNGAFTFDGQTENANGDYFLISSQQFGKLLTNSSGGCYGYEVYDHDTSSTAGLVSTVLDNQANVGMIVDTNGVRGSVVVDAINGQSTATISADKVNLNGYVTITSLADNSTTTINGAEICSGVIKSNNYVAGSAGTYIDLSSGAIYSKNFNVDASGNVSVTGTLDANMLKIKGVNVLTTEDKIAADYLELKGLTIRNNSNQVTLQIDSNGNVTLAGSISWSNITNVPSSITGAYTLAQNAATAADDAYTVASNAQTAANKASNTVSGWTYGSTTYIDGAMIASDTVLASKLLGGEVSLLNKNKVVCGTLTITDATTSNYAIDLRSYGALRLESEWGSAYLASFTHFINVQDDEKFITVGVTTESGYANTSAYADAGFAPAKDIGYSLGGSSNRWKVVYTESGEIGTSDSREKQDIEYNMDKYESFFKDLKPTQYKFIDGESNRYHVGFVSQDVESALSANGLTSLDFAGFIKSPIYADKEETIISDHRYGLRYSEFIALNTHMIQKLYKRIDELETQIKNISAGKE